LDAIASAPSGGVLFHCGPVGIGPDSWPQSC
jgi:hypothetical protein